jgi:hypothetical protein
VRAMLLGRVSAALLLAEALAMGVFVAVMYSGATLVLVNNDLKHLQALNLLIGATAAFFLFGASKSKDKRLLLFSIMALVVVIASCVRVALWFGLPG